MIQNLGALVKECKKFLREYLEEKGIKTTGKLFQCPNREEHSNRDAKPSANFFPDDKSWHCFSCEYKAKLGDIFEAVHVLEHKDIKGENFVLVVKYLCDKYKIPYKETTTEEEQFLKSVSSYLTKLVESAHTSLKNNIDKNSDLKKLLEKKQWTASIDTFKLGYLDSPYATTVDKDVLSYLNLDPKNLVKRLIIPIRNLRGTIVGVTTRSLEVDTKTAVARYMHFISYSLKKLLFGISQVDPTKEVVLVEGPSSVITLNSFGVSNAIATFGNYMHINQYSLMVKKGIKKVLFLYDGDVGGKEGLRNSLESLCKGDLKVRIGLLQEDLDPGDYMIQNKKLANIDTIDLYTYLIDSYMANTDDKLIEKCLMTHINSIKDIVKQEKVVNEVSKKLKINKSTIADLLGIYKKGSNVSVKDVLKEREALVQTLNDFEKWSWSRGTLLGLKSFESFDTKLDGMQNGLVLLGGKPNIGKTLHGDTLITTEDGIVPISYYAEKGQRSETFRPFKKKLPIPLLEGYTSHFFYGYSKTTKITLSNGVTLEATPENPIAKYEKNHICRVTQFKDLKIGDSVPIQVGTNWWGKTLDISHAAKTVRAAQKSGRYTRIPTKYPLQWTPELAYLVGFHLGDGSGTTPDFQITSDGSFIPYVQKLVKQLFGIKMTRTAGTRYTYAGGCLLRKFFKEIGIKYQKHDNIDIPISILTAPKEIVAGFIRGYFDADGFADERGEASFTSKSRKFLSQLQTILFNFGIISSLKTYKKRATNSTSLQKENYHTLYVACRYEELVKFYRDVLRPNQKWNNVQNRKTRRIQNYTAEYASQHKYTKALREVRYSTSEIVNIEKYSTEKEVYDLTVPESHLFVGNGLIVHNSAVLITLATKLVQRNSNIHLLYFTIDDSIFVTLSRFIANLSGLPINIVSNPNYRITKADIPDHVKQEYIERREGAMNFLRKHSSIFSLKDSSEGSTIEMIKEKVKTIVPLAEGKQLVVFIDNLHNLRSNKYVSDRHLYSLISNELNNIANEYKCPVIASTHITKESIRNKQYDGNAIKETVEFFYDAKLILFIDANEEELESTRDDLEVKIIVSKNKFSAYKGRIPMTFYRSLSRVVELTGKETEQNLFDGDTK